MVDSDSSLINVNGVNPNAPPEVQAAQARQIQRGEIGPNRDKDAKNRYWLTWVTDAARRFDYRDALLIPVLNEKVRQQRIDQVDTNNYSHLLHDVHDANNTRLTARKDPVIGSLIRRLAGIGPDDDGYLLNHDIDGTTTA